MATHTRNLPAVSEPQGLLIPSGAHAAENIVGLLAIDEPLAPLVAVEDISGLDLAGCLDRAERAIEGLRSLARLSSLQVWIAGQALDRAKRLTRHGKWLSTLKERDIAEATARQAIRVYHAFPDQTMLPRAITQAKVEAGIVKGQITEGSDDNAQGMQAAPEPSPAVKPDARAAVTTATRRHEHEADGGEVRPEATPTGDWREIPATGGRNWLDGEPTGDVGRGYVWQVFTSADSVRAVWAPVASVTDLHVITTTGVRIARAEGIYRTRRDALLGATNLLAEEVERLRADLDEAEKSLSKVVALLDEV